MNLKFLNLVLHSLQYLTEIDLVGDAGTLHIHVVKAMLAQIAQSPTIQQFHCRPVGQDVAEHMLLCDQEITKHVAEHIVCSTQNGDLRFKMGPILLRQLLMTSTMPEPSKISCKNCYMFYKQIQHTADHGTADQTASCSTGTGFSKAVATAKAAFCNFELHFALLSCKSSCSYFSNCK